MRKQTSISAENSLPPLPLDAETWTEVAKQLSLSSQQLRIVELILHDCQDKQIAEELNIAVSTLRSHLERIHHRLGSSGRTGLILHVFKMAQDLKV